MPSNQQSSAPLDQEGSSSTACASVSALDDAAIAQCLHAMQQLTSIFQFTPQQAQDAIDAVGPDVNLAYNYILDQGGEDKGGTIIPVENCPHVSECVRLDAENIEYENICTHFKDGGGKSGGLKGEVVDGGCPSGENWLCLHCGVVRCSRYVNGHCKDHWEFTKATDNDSVGHCVAVSLEDLSVWCYECEAYIIHPSLSSILKRVEKKKFGVKN